jgi:hypothetical protein
LKAFFSALSAALVIAAITASAIAVLHLSSQEEVQLAQVSAKIASDRHASVKQFFADAVNDALADAAYSVYGCAPSKPNFCEQVNRSTSTDKVVAYLNWSLSATNNSLVAVSYSLANPYATLPYECYEFAAEPGYNHSFNYSTLLNLRVDSPNAFKQDQTLLSRNVSVRDYAPKIINASQTCSEAQLLRITITGNYGAAKDFLVDCNQTIDLGNNPCP